MKPRKHRKRPRSPKIRRLWDRLASLGFRKFTLWWEPIGPALEMCGHSGGYMLEEHPGRETTPLGLSLDEALPRAERHAEYVRAFEPERLSGAA